MSIKETTTAKDRGGESEKDRVLRGVKGRKIGRDLGWDKGIIYCTVFIRPVKCHHIVIFMSYENGS